MRGVLHAAVPLARLASRILFGDGGPQGNRFRHEQISFSPEFDHISRILPLHQIAVDRSEYRFQLLGPTSRQIDSQNPRIVVPKEQPAASFVTDAEESAQVL